MVKIRRRERVGKTKKRSVKKILGYRDREKRRDGNELSRVKKKEEKKIT